MKAKRIVVAWLAVPVVCALGFAVGAQTVGSLLVLVVLALGITMAGTFGSQGEHGTVVRRSGVCLGVGLIAVSMAATIGLASPMQRTIAIPAEPLTSVGVMLMGLGLLALLNAQTPDRAIGTLFEGLLCVTALIFFPWAAAANGGAPLAAAQHLLPLLIDGLVLGLAVRVALGWRDAREQFGLVVTAISWLVIVDVVRTTGLISGANVPHEWFWLIRILACVVIALALTSPAIPANVEPIVTLPGARHPGRLVAPLGLTLLAPALFTLQSMRGEPPPLPVVLAGSSVLALLVAVFLVQQVYEGASAEFRAHHDPLTGLPHRALFHDRLELALTQARHNDGCVGLMFLDLDRFKSINDSLGHAVGNQLLQRVGERLLECVREEDTVARVGGDEFTILMPTVPGMSDCTAVAEKILLAFVEPFTVGGRDLFTTSSIGVAVFPDCGTDADALIKSADIAMYRAKANGRNRFQTYTTDMGTRAEVKHALERNLRHAVENGELELHYQPKVDARTSAIVGLEALARWHHDDLGYIPPNVFVPLAEESGLIVPLGDWVLDQSCSQIRRWHDEYGALMPVAVNVSAYEFTHRRVDARVADALHRHGVDPQLLELEITESIFMHDLEGVTKALFNLQALGVSCSIDDFGTGYSGLTYLSQLPIFSLKIDHSFVKEIGASPTGNHIVDAVITLARSLQLKVVAEGVETEGQADYLRLHGCDQLQGYLFSPPLELTAVDDLLGSQSEPPPATGMHAAALFGRPRVVAACGPATDLLDAVCRSDRVESTFEDSKVAEVLAALELPPADSPTVRPAPRWLPPSTPILEPRERVRPTPVPRFGYVPAEARPEVAPVGVA